MPLKSWIQQPIFAETLSGVCAGWKTVKTCIFCAGKNRVCIEHSLQQFASVVGICFKQFVFNLIRFDTGTITARCKVILQRFRMSEPKVGRGRALHLFFVCSSEDIQSPLFFPDYWQTRGRRLLQRWWINLTPSGTFDIFLLFSYHSLSLHIPWRGESRPGQAALCQTSWASWWVISDGAGPNWSGSTGNNPCGVRGHVRGHVQERWRETGLNSSWYHNTDGDGG